MKENNFVYLAGVITCIVLIVIAAMWIIPVALCAALCIMTFVSTFLLLSNKKKEDDEL
jgi:Flp pilus assembly protein TadB